MAYRNECGNPGTVYRVGPEGTDLYRDSDGLPRRIPGRTLRSLAKPPGSSIARRPKLAEVLPDVELPADGFIQPSRNEVERVLAFRRTM